MPGGRVEPGESPWDAIRREVSEETSLQVEVIRLAGVYWRPARDLLVLQFECRGDGHPSPSPEAREVRYFSMDALPEPINPAVIERTGVVRSAEPGVRMRTQQVPAGREWAAAWKHAHASPSC